MSVRADMLQAKRWLMPLLLAAGLCACASAPRVNEPDTLMATAQPAPAPQAGAIYASGQGMSLFEDQKARNVGDVLTILLVEPPPPRPAPPPTPPRTAAAP